MKPVVLNTGSRNEQYEGLTVLHKPLIEICALPLTSTIREQYDWLIFTSKNAVQLFFKYYPNVTFDKVAAIGIKTAQALQKLNIHVDFIPTRYQQEHFIDEMGELFHHKTICLPISKKARTNMYDTLKNIATVDRIELYEPRPNEENVKCVHQFILDNKVDWLMFLSPSAVQAYFSRHTITASVRVIAIGQVTSNALDHFNIEHIISEKETMQHMFETITKLNKGRY